MHILKSSIFVLAALYLGSPAAGQAAESAADFYKGKTVTVTVGFDAGGGYGLLTTLVAKSLGKHIPGNPAVVAQFMPGGGGIKQANYLFNAAPRDGLVIGLLYDGIPTNELLYTDKGIKYKSAEFTALGSLAEYDPGLIAVRPDTPVSSFEDVKKTEVVLAAAGRGVNQFIIPNMLNKTTGTKFKIVTGYKSIGNMMVAMEQGEVQGTLGSYSIFDQVRPDWIRDRKLKWLVQMAIERDPRVKDVPLLQEVTDDRTTKDVFVFLTLGRTMTKGLVAPPRIPADRAAALRAAVMALGKDAEFLDAAKKSRVNIDVRPWQRLEKLIRDTVNTDPKIVEATRQMTGG